MPLPELRTPRLRLRPFAEDDVDALHAVWTDAGVRRFLWDDITIERDRAEQTLRSSLEDVERRGYGMWTLHFSAREGVIGFCGFRPLDGTRDPQIVYGVLAELWGQGLVVEASRAALAHLFESCSPERVWALSDLPNAQSFRVMEKLGMSFDRDAPHDGLPARFYVLEGASMHP